MKFYEEKFVSLVRHYRSRGLSIKTLAKKFHVSETTVSRWARYIESKNIVFQRSRIKEKNHKHRFADLSKKLVPR